MSATGSTTGRGADRADHGWAESEGTRRFRAARDTLLRHREDLDAACREFRWPVLDRFNWALDWFDVVARDNHATALRVVGGGDGLDHSVSFAGLSERSDRVASWLRGLGVRRGDPVLLVLGNRVELWECVLALTKLGAVAVPTFTTATGENLVDRLRRARVRFVVAEAGLTGGFAGLSGGWSGVSVGGAVPGWSDYAEADGVPGGFVPDGETLAEDPLFLYFTSGTTSRPKIVRHTHQSYPVGHLSGMYWNGLRPGDRHLNISAPGWAKHAWSSLFVPWNAEATVLALADHRPSPEAVLRCLREEGATSFCAPPTVWRALVAAGPGERPPQLAEATSAGEPLEADLLDRVERAWGVRVRDGYGQTETTAQAGTPPGRTPRPGRMGWPLPGYRLAVLEREGHAPVPNGEPGELCVELAERPLGVASGYIGDEERGARAFSGSHYRTGDLVVREEDGSLRYVGRTDDMFKSFDHRISPLELERVLRAHPAVADCAVVPLAHPVGDWEPKAFVVARPGADGARDAGALLDHVARHLPPEMRVRVVEFVSELPRTASGKVVRARLRERPHSEAETYRSPDPR